ncbi:MAG: hypothetical protein ABW146_15315 [Candidatus Sedimenticola sp. 6PFRAG7]
MKIVIQCAAKKDPNAGYLINGEGKPVLFVANPEKAPPSDICLYAHPDDLAERGKTWRELLIDYNNRTENNPLNLCPAYTLYSNSTYALLVDRFGADNVFILSAGWGLISAEFLTPKYDITFAQTPRDQKYKQRSNWGQYRDICMLPTEADDDLVFFGGKGYLPLFCALTRSYRGHRFVFYNSNIEPDTPGCALVRYPTTTRTNWHYSCAKDFMAGTIGI